MSLENEAVVPQDVSSILADNLAPIGSSIRNVLWICPHTKMMIPEIVFASSTKAPKVVGGLSDSPGATSNEVVVVKVEPKG